MKRKVATRASARERAGLSAVARIAVSLGALVAMVVVLTGFEVRRASATIDDAGRIAAASRELRALLQLQAQVEEEHFQLSGVQVAVKAGISLPTIQAITGIDLAAAEATWLTAITRTVAELGPASPVTVAELTAARDAGPTGMADASDRIRRASTASGDRLRQLVADAGTGHGVVPALDGLVDISRLGPALVNQTSEYLNVMVDVDGQPVEVHLRRLVVAEGAVAELVERLASRADGVGDAVRSMRESATYQTFQQASTDLVHTWLASAGGAKRSVAQLVALAPVARAGVDSSQHVKTAGDAATVQLQAATAEAAASARASLRRALLALGAAVVCMLAASVWLARTVARPIAALGRHAALLSSGDTPDTSLAVHGARELRVAAGQMNHLVEALRVAERQAGALASGELDDPVLQRELPGRLGAALSGAVNRLATSIAESQALNERLAHDAHHDGLTQLPNRRAALDALARTGHDGPAAATAVLFVDLDGFKAVNDEHGHAAGDQVLIVVAERLRRAVRPDDLVARLGGDEFLVLSSAPGGLSDASALSRRLVEVIGQPIALADTDAAVTVGASIGLALLEEGCEAEAILRQADHAMYAAKSASRSR